MDLYSSTGKLVKAVLRNGARVAGRLTAWNDDFVWIRHWLRGEVRIPRLLISRLEGR